MKCKFIRFQDFRCKGPGTNTVIQEQEQGTRGELGGPKEKAQVTGHAIGVGAFAWWH